MKTIKKTWIGLALASIICTAPLLITGCKSTSMEGSVYVNDNAKNTPMVFSPETAGVLEFIDDNKVKVLFPYAIKLENTSIPISSELTIDGEYSRTGNTVTISLKVNESQTATGVLEAEVKDDGKTLVCKGGVQFKKIDPPVNNR
ncbi:MAG: hypothetical protein LBU98_02945 [Alistipes sp.]|jgi:hypothetical protein|nr:hypothetical protein [Alistipes sp.]